MSKRSKLEKFAENLQLPNVFENFSYETPQLQQNADQIIHLQGVWKSQYFHNDHPLVLELACGRGEYCLGLAKQHPSRNYIGVDIKGARIWKGAKTALFMGLHNVAFVRTRIECLHAFFGPGEVDEIWITFPDPFLRESKAGRRLTSGPFLNRYTQILKPGASVHLKTDDPSLYAFSLESIEQHPQFVLDYCDDDIYRRSELSADLRIQTYYERMHLAHGKSIKYIRCHYQPVS